MTEKGYAYRLDSYIDAALETVSSDLGIPKPQIARDAVIKYISENRPVKKGKYKFIDLFAGIGGMRIAFENADCSCVYSCEWNPYSQKTYFANFLEMPEGDITKVKENDIPDHDILVAGFPCQPFSLAGVSKKNSLGRPTGFKDKTQGTLFFDVCRILEAKRPKALLLENVKNLVSHDKKRTFQTILEALDQLDYEIYYQIIDGQNYVPQHRERIMIVGFDRKRYGTPRFEFKITPVLPKPKVSDILQKNPDDKYTLSDHLWEYLQSYAEKHRKKGNGFGYGIASLDGITRTLSARYHKDGSEILIAQEEKNPRRLTPRECARLQGFPETFKIPVSDTRAYMQFGNSVVVPAVEEVAREIVNTLDRLEQNGKEDWDRNKTPELEQLKLDGTVEFINNLEED